MSADLRAVLEHERRLLCYARRLTHGREADADDLVQEMYLRLLTHDMSGVREPLAYALVVIRNQLGNERIARRIERGMPSLETARAHEVADDHMDVERLVDAEAAAERLDAKLAQLSPTRRRVWEMHECEDYTYEEIAAIVGCSTSMVKKHLHLVDVFLAEPGREPPVRKAAAIDWSDREARRKYYREYARQKRQDPEHAAAQRERFRAWKARRAQELPA